VVAAAQAVNSPGGLTLDDLVYRRERTLAAITLVLGIIGWLVVIIGTIGIALVGLLFAFVIYLFAQSALIAHIKGNGVELSATQFPDLYEQFVACCNRLGIQQPPKAYILNGNGGLNAFATKFLGAQYVVLYSDVVDAMNEHADGVRFYIGHELGHLRMRHLSARLFRLPALWLPLLGAAYSRAQESTCDRHGLACSASGEGAAKSLAALAAGSQRWKRLNVAEFGRQTSETTGFWMSFHELIASYPWITKRAARVMDLNSKLPSRNPFAYLLAIFIPYAGRLGGFFGFVILVYIVAILAAIAVPAYQDYTVRAQVSLVWAEAEYIMDTVGRSYETNEEIPPSLEALRLPNALADGTPLRLAPEDMYLEVDMEAGVLYLAPGIDGRGRVTWRCEPGDGMSVTQMPAFCVNGVQ